ncbi:MAG: substrate-binding domain-containing protein [Treponemataceae bacterium]
MKKWSAILVGFALFLVVGCTPKNESEIKMGFLIRNLNEDFVRLYADNLKEVADAAGVDYKLLDGNSDVATQLDQLNTLLTQGYKYFVIIPQDTDSTEQMSKLIHAKGGAASYSNIQPSTAALKVSENFFLASSPEIIAGQNS